MTKVLVVDDHPTNRELVATLVRHRGWQALEAGDGAEGLDVLKRERPDLVICDILMPTMDGYEFVRRLRDDPELSATTVIFYSAHYRAQEAHNLAHACGVERVVSKPCEPAELLRVMDEALAGAQTAIPAARPDAAFDREHLRLVTDQLTHKAQELDSRNRRLAALTDLNLQLASEADPAVLLDKVCRGARDLIGASYAVLLVRGKNNGGEMSLSLAGVRRELVAGLPLPTLTEGRLGQVYAQREPMRVRVPQGDPAWLGLPPQYPPLRAALAVPVASLSHVYGWLLLANKLGAENFTDEDEQILGILGAQVGRIYENGSLYHQLRRQAERLQEEVAAREKTAQVLVGLLSRQEALRLIDASILAAHSPHDVATVALEHLSRSLPCWLVGVLTIDAQDQVRMLARRSGEDTHADGGATAFTVEQFGAVDVALLRQGQVVYVADVEAQAVRSHVIEALYAQGMRSYLRVPMRAEGGLVGSLSLGADRPDYFTEDQIEFARAIADHLGLAIQQSSLRERIGRQAQELEQKVVERTAQLQAANDDLRSFSYTVSHDLRAPLRSIQGFANILQESQGARMDEDGRHLLGVIRKSGARMDELIRDLMSFSQTGQARISVSEIDMDALVREVWAGLERSASVDFTLDPLPPAQGDYTLMRQVWTNLLSNAIKYSGKREAPRVRVSAPADAQGAAYCVMDNGAGFEPRYADKLFKVFQRLHAESEFPGTGVGLAIVHRIVTRHGGRVWAESTPEAGAQFYFSLPKDENRAPAA